MKQKTCILFVSILFSMLSKAQESVYQDSALKAYFVEKNLNYPIDYSHIDTCAYITAKISSKKIDPKFLVRLSSISNDNYYDIKKIRTAIIDTLNELDEEFMGTRVYSTPVFYYDTYTKSYILEINLITFLYSEDPKYQYSKWSRFPRDKYIYFKTAKKHYFKL